MRKFGKLVAVSGLLVMLLSGCGQTAVPEDIQESALSVSASGQLTFSLVGEFDRDYYDLAELRAMAEENVAVFGGNVEAGTDGTSAGRTGTDGTGTDPVTVKSVEAAQDGSSRVVVTYSFDSAESFESFLAYYDLGERFFYGTVAEAAARGYEAVILRSAQSGDSMMAGALLQEPERHLIVTDTAAYVYCPDRVEYISEGAVLNQDGSVDTTKASGLVYILLRK